MRTGEDVGNRLESSGPQALRFDARVFFDGFVRAEGLECGIRG